MKAFMSVLALVLFAGVAQADLSSKHAASDRALLQKFAVSDAAITASLAKTARPAAQLDFLDQKLVDGCIDSCVANCQGGAGSSACWQRCGNEGYGSATCAPRCGIATALGSQACWQRCGNLEGYSSQTCAPRCGVATAEGTQACWNRCSTEGYSSETCAQRCGNN